MPKQPEAIINFEVYEDSVNYIGIAKVSLPNVNYIVQQISGAGIGGNVDAVMHGMVDAMECGLNFRSATDSAVSLLAPRKHNIDLRVAEQAWETVNSQREIIADKFVLVMVPKTYQPGSVAPASPSDASGTYAVYYYAAYRDGKQLWEIDPYNYICTVNGVDYMAPVRRALGK